MNRINLDTNASFGILPEVKQAISESCSYLNPNSIHFGGQQARAAVEAARTEVANLLGIGKNYQIVFTSGATESNNHAVHSSFFDLLNLPRSEREKFGFIVNALEHPCIIEPARRLQQLGFSGVFIKPNQQGEITKDCLEAALAQQEVSFKPIFSSFMAVNNETGQIFNFKDLFSKLKAISPEIICHSDFVQSVGKLDFSFQDSDLDLVTISGHKIGALTGIGALIVSDRVQLNPMILGGAQEKRFRAGTQNVLGIISFGIAAQVLRKNKEARLNKLHELDRFFEEHLRQQNLEISFNYEGPSRVPGVFNIRIHGVNAQDLVVALDLHGVQVSAGSACASGKPKPSHVLSSMGFSEEHVHESIRISFGALHSKQELEAAIEIIAKCVQQIKSSNVTYAQCAIS